MIYTGVESKNKVYLRNITERKRVASLIQTRVAHDVNEFHFLYGFKSRAFLLFVFVLFVTFALLLFVLFCFFVFLSSLCNTLLLTITYILHFNEVFSFAFKSKNTYL